MMPKELEEQIKAITVPKIEVVKPDGKPTSIDDYDSFMQFLMLAAQASQLTKIRKALDHVKEYFDDRTSEGWVQNFDNIPVTGAEPSQEIRLDFPAQSISITNDAPVGGPVVWVEINNRFHTRRTLNPLEVLNINFETHKLERFFVQCPPGLTANIRATARG